MKIAAAGDAIIQRRIQESFPGYKEISPFIKEADASFFNLETTLNKIGECPASQFSGGTYIRCEPECLLDVMDFGFNMTSFNNNHALDFSYEGLDLTLSYLDESGITHAGVGRNLAEASMPKYLDTGAGRVALIAVNSSFDPSMMAGEASPLFPGRRGINGLRLNKYITLPEHELKFIRDIAKKTNINAQKEITRREGYFPPLAQDTAELGELKFKLSDKESFVMEVESCDTERVRTAIYEASLQADYVIVSVHSHQISGDAKECPAEFLVKFAHDCIDFGANAVIGHGPHLLRPIEIYKDSPIFYSLGDFILELYSVPAAPADFFRKQKMSPDETVHDLLKKRSKNFTVGLMEDKRMFMSVIPRWEVEDGKLKNIELLPIMLNMDGTKSDIGLPRVGGGKEIFEYLREMSLPYGTEMELSHDGLIRIKL